MVPGPQRPPPCSHPRLQNLPDQLRAQLRAIGVLWAILPILFAIVSVVYHQPYWIRRQCGHLQAGLLGLFHYCIGNRLSRT
ncbi:LHFPL tetraspan subfamily member 3 protein [Lates japonicus]|uniref:LHFPL tetraspan subfamily member 3 protein n=1 Tax=Lates japonicus TaxID=270547 RepID=A0AAD3NLJ0_LATJO|nr:LHFPL tetraspan subfamily member 3 protein [Lates japonicus]